MLLGIRSKSRKSVSTQVHFIIHVQEIKPWLPSQSLRSVQSVLLQWENDDQNSGSLASSAGNGSIQFNESFRLSVLLWREASKKSKHLENFQKNYLDFNLYDKAAKSQLLGSVTINLADFGTLKEIKAIMTQLNCKKSFKNSTQPYLYISIQPVDTECSSSSPNSTMSKELSLYKEESESVSQSVNDDDDLEIVSFTDDDNNDDVPSNTSYSIRSSPETTGDKAKISKGGRKGSNGELVTRLEHTTSSLLGSMYGAASTKFNGIKSPSSSMGLSSDMGNAASDRPSFPRVSDKGFKVADASFKIPKSIQQFLGKNITEGKDSINQEVEMLHEELREAAALEVSLYSVIAEHGSSSNKVHAPARRLSRFYFHTCRVGSPATIASAAKSAVSGFVLVSKACGNDVPRLTFWFSNLILMRAIVSKGIEETFHNGPCINRDCDGNDPPCHEKEKTKDKFHSWEDPETFVVALEKVEAWMFSRIVESVWWQTLTPYMQSAAAKSSRSRKINGKRYGLGDQDQVNFSVDLWKRAFKDAGERLCPLQAGGHECGCLPVIAILVMEQLVNRLDIAMFNAILRESDEEMPTDPISDPISDSKVLPIPAGKSGFGAGVQLKNAISNWTRWLSDLFGTVGSDSHEHSNQNEKPNCESAVKPFQLLRALSDLMMLPFEMLADESMRKEVCPRFGVSLIKQVVNNFVPDEFSPGPVPVAVIEALNDEDIQDDEGSITSIPCTAGSTFYTPPLASLVVSMRQEVGTRKLYTSDDELDELDSPLSVIGMDESSPSSKKKLSVAKGARKVIRYELLRKVWRSTE
ncbi:hypothetical protein TanjilG_08376 [Lupinus angustifolius]|uniref:C2 NT-type domain-containing protein n=1 Tax=Lupinus angustifolius TaxID=3871 RepID=A0A1J7HZQ4_LUPAN|nr:PREDICTED: uncharacterized protein LOC109354243 [Lupinus angustifolius]XP_019452149.1 PREDICTED: uncharacterized protein LOC109354243 [Lupinus angustifolius]XP_019452150.1 PREDICTED: uncharacterized protein LOC109354243 [Lupinus angustifolius]XP_019452151.1 PREDICTED: uncharacterized protein LOC109354243 [Lupinus angustifolius]OIW07261.1 hypothetical protein TanjilG_08376 [Lupinus angustifolius]